VTASQNATGIGLMTLSMALLTSGDATIKSLAGRYSQPVLLLILGLGLALIFHLAARRRGLSLSDRRALTGAALVRSLAEIAASVTMIFALALVPFTTITMVMQAMPLLVTLGAVVFFGEHVGWRRWAAIFAGFVGVIVILGPGGAAFTPVSLLALGVAVALSLRDLASRAVPRDIPTVLITGWGGIAVAFAGLVLLLISGEPLPQVAAADLPRFAMILAFLAGGIFSVSAAMRMGDVGAVAPFRYTRLPFGLALGVLVFDEAVSLNDLTGVAIIVASGLYIFFRERASAARL